MTGLRWTRRARIVAGGVLIGATVTAGARALPGPVEGGPVRYPAVVRCDQLAEDSAAHVRLVRYRLDAEGRPVLAYRCTRGGY